MNKKFEQFLIWYLPVLIISRLSKGMLLPFMVSRLASYEDQTLTYLSLTYAAMIAALLEHVVAAVWIWKNGTRNQKRILWSAFALFSGLWGVLFFFAVIIYEKITSGNSQPLNLGEKRSNQSR
jgi:FtsH-binding integral membrane protein